MTVLRAYRSGWGPPVSEQQLVVHGVGIAAVASQVPQDGSRDLGIENEGEDTHLGAAAAASERIDLEDASQEFGPAPSECAERRPGRHRLPVGIGRQGSEPGLGEDAALSPASAPADGVGTGIADEDLVSVGDVGKEQR